MWSIARRTGMDVNKLAVMNGMQPGDPLRAGQRLKLSNSESTPRGGSGSRKVTYVVRSGDTLTQIAKLFQVSVKEIMAWNGIGARTAISAGQKLTIRLSSRRG
jgi:membrane-bound lytic murein transglycosylase D